MTSQQNFPREDHSDPDQSGAITLTRSTGRLVGRPSHSRNPRYKKPTRTRTPLWLELLRARKS